jgi:hypothetical protein
VTALSRAARPAAAVAVLVAAGVAAAGAGAATVHCLAASIGPGSLRHPSSGAHCMLLEFHDHCHPADYVLSEFGVDTAHEESFRLALQSHRCRVLVTETFRVIPQQEHMVGRRTCKRLRQSGSDVIADLCTGGPPAIISLTKLTQ